MHSPARSQQWIATLIVLFAPKLNREQWLIFDFRTPQQYLNKMILSFADVETENLWHGEPCRLPPDIIRRAERKLVQLDTAVNLWDLRVPPGNRLEPLTGDRQGQHSIRINRQWRICFRWEEDGVHDVEIVDYH